MNDRATNLAHAAEQFLAIVGDGNLAEMTPYLVDIFEDSLRQAMASKQRARKVGGSYEANGTIVSTFATLEGRVRHVFEFDEPRGLLHIFGPEQIELEP